MNVAIYANQKRIDHLLTVAEEVEDLSQSAHWAKYLCVLACGHLEVAVETILRDYATSASNPSVARFAGFAIRHVLKSPKVDNVLDVVGSFNPAWKNDLEAKVEGEVKESVNSMVGQRHLIAHGRDSDLSLGRFKGYYAGIKKFIVQLDTTCC